ncbi:MAG: CPBP family intramembrane metalloprotease [Myxococcales bacterium]|nr:CPBP family intramembrane metalloprotease [Myxococcales bacterium]
MIFTAPDVLLLLILGVLYPSYSWAQTRQLQRALARGEIALPYDPSEDYRTTIAVQWLLAAFVLALWIWTGRSASLLGLRPVVVDAWLGWGTLLAVAGLLPTAVQLALVSRRPSLRASLRAQFRDLAMFIPRTAAQQRWFHGVALTAGICEELLYRGFLIACLSTWTTDVVAMLLAALLFGAVHLYQGPAKALQIVGIGVWMGSLYLLTGALWLPMLTHAVLDLLGGSLLHRALWAPATDGRPVTAP